MKNFIKKIKSMIFFESKPNKDSSSIDENYFDIFISLDKNFNINVLISMYDSKIETMTENNTALVYHEFLSGCFTKDIQNTVVQILKRDIEDDGNRNLINKITTLIEHKQRINEEFSYIKPSQVFIKHSKDNQ